MVRPSGHKLDDTDRKIMVELQKEPRLGYRKLGKLVNLTYTPCRRRVKKLMDDGFITISASVQTEKFLRKNSYCILVEMGDTSTKAVDFVKKTILSIKEVDLCWELDGAWDFVLRLHVDEDSKFEQIRAFINDLSLNDKRIVLRTQSAPIALVVKGFLPLESLKAPLRGQG